MYAADHARTRCGRLVISNIEASILFHVDGVMVYTARSRVLSGKHKLSVVWSGHFSDDVGALHPPHPSER